MSNDTFRDIGQAEHVRLETDRALKSNRFKLMVYLLFAFGLAVPFAYWQF